MIVYITTISPCVCNVRFFIVLMKPTTVAKLLLQATILTFTTGASSVSVAEDITSSHSDDASQKVSQQINSVSSKNQVIPKGLIPVTIAERLQALRQKESLDPNNPIIPESSADLDPAQIIRSIDQAFATKDLVPIIGGDAVNAGEAAEAAGQVTAELLDQPPTDPIDLALYVQTPEPLDNVFLAAKTAYDSGNYDRLNELSLLLENHPLMQYIELWKLVLKLKSTPSDPQTNAQILQFIKNHHNEYIGERALVDYLHLVSDQIGAQAFRELYNELQWNKDDPVLRGWNAYYNLTTPSQQLSEKEALRQAQELYRDAPNNSLPIYKTLGDEITTNDRSWAWTRVILLLQKNQWNEAKRVLPDVPRPELPANIATLQALIDQPLAWYNDQKDLSRIPVRLGIIAALRLVQVDPDLAAKVASQAINPRASSFWRSLVWMRIGYVGISRLDPSATKWFAQSRTSLTQRPLLVYQYNNLIEWQARAAMRAGNWYSLSRIIEKLPASVRSSEIWTYWYARSLEARGLNEQAKRYYAQIADRVSFYGKLADEALNIPYATQSKDLPTFSDYEIERWDDNPSILRARALYRMHLYAEGHREWGWAMRGLSAKDYLSLSTYARSKFLIHRMINTSERTGTSLININQRYPMPLYGSVKKVSQAQNIPLAWVYGIIRQESRFIPRVHSAVGAQGLMQVMPATAAWIAQRLGINSYDQTLLTSLQMNLVLGSAYLHMLYADLGESYTLATAAYNAGPARARIWLSTVTSPMDGAVFAETIPYYETRDYVKNVLSNMHTYMMLTQKTPPKFSQLIGTINPDSTTPLMLP